MREHVNLQELDNEGANVLFWCTSCYCIDICLRYGVDMHTIAITNAYAKCNAFQYHLKWFQHNGGKEYMAMALMLLSAGADPRNSEIPEEMKTEVRRWVSSLGCAKRLLAKIFDNASLEREARDFHYNERFLRKALSN